MSTLKNKRAGEKAVCTKATNELEAELNAQSPDRTKIESLVNLIRSKLSKIETITESFLEEIEDRTEVINEKLKEYEYESKISIVLTKSDQFIAGLNTGSSVHVQKEVHLPKISLNKFDDTILGWSAFWDAFYNAVDKRSDLSPSQKFTYLKGLLQGDSLIIVDSLAVDDASYNVAIKLLKDTYDNPTVSIITQVENLHKLNILDYSLNDVRNFRANFESIIASLQILKCSIVDNASAEMLVIASVLSKLPKVMSNNMRRSAGNDIFKLSKFREVLKIEMELLSSVNEGKDFSLIESNDKPVMSTGNFALASNSNNSSNNKNNNPKSKSKPKKNFGRPTQPYCHFCDIIGHTSGNCTVYPDAASRLERLKVLPNRCKTCWFRTHGNQPCVKLFCKNCKQDHWTAICTRAKKSTSVTTNNIGTSNSVVLPTVLIPYFEKGHEYEFRCILDQCSQRTLILKSTVSKFSIPVVKKEFIAMNVVGESRAGQFYDVVELSIGMTDDPINISAIVVSELPNVQTKGIEKFSKELITKDIKLADPKLSTFIDNITILIGGDFYYKIVKLDKLPLVINEVVLMPTKFGYCVTGSLPDFYTDRSSTTVNVATILNLGETLLPWNENCLPQNNDDSIDKLWLIDNIGITDDSKVSTDDEVLCKFNRSIIYNEASKQYTVSFPWTESVINLPNNYALAKGRLNSLLKRLDQNKDLLENYDTVIKEQIMNDFIEKVPENELIRPNTHYLPHHPVIKDHPTTPIRIVMDCSAKIKGHLSLNDCLYVGPSLVPLLAQIILRLRMNKYICMGDISKAFLRILLNESDRDMTRFLWRHKYNDTSSSFDTFRFKRVLFGSSSSPFLLQATVRHHLERFDCVELGRNLYVDNIHFGSDSEMELLEFYEKCTKIFLEAGLPLREWFSNCNDFNIKVGLDNQAMVDPGDDIRILGVLWNVKNDYFHIVPANFSLPETATKRSILRDAGKIFDPIGMLIPVTISIRIFLQQLWSLKYGWDDLLDNSLRGEWSAILDNLNMLKDIKIERWVIKSKTVTLHIFSDSSKLAYGCCAYIVYDGHSELLMAKARVAPVKELTIPKLELLSALLSSRLGLFIIETYKLELFIEEIHLWIDSQAVLAWVLSEKENKSLYVRNRIKEIRNNVPTAKFHYINSGSNPADLITKPVKDLSNLDIWWYGPHMLLNKDTWIEYVPSEEVTTINEITQNAAASNNGTKEHEKWIDFKRFSSWVKLVRTIVFVKKFIDIKLLRKNIDSNVSPSEFKWAKLILIIDIQKRWYFEEIQYLKNNSNGNTPQLIKDLWLILDNGILRVNSRLEYSILTFDEKFPILLPSRDYVTLLIIHDIHKENNHASVSVTISCLRQYYWVPQCRRTVTKVVFNCKWCQKYRINRYKVPFSPPLPSYRINESRPFQFCGVDLTGALYVKDNDNVRKVYMVLFTCASSRAVHLELAEDLSAYSFARVYRRFVSRRSTPQLMLSDNATNFISFVPQLKEFQENSSIKNLLLKSNTEWHFIPARAPWFGGMWERLIGICKRIIKSALGKSLVSYDELQTIIVEVEGQVNSRPLTHCSTNSEDIVPITPSHLLFGYKLNSLPFETNVDLNEDYEFSNPSSITKRHKLILEMIKQATILWKREYLLALRERDRKVKPVSKDGDIIPKEGDVVHIVDDLKVSDWKLGRIIKLKISSDGQHRVALVKTANGTVDRPISKLSYLESSEFNDISAGGSEATIPEPQAESNLKSKRSAAVGAQSKIAGWVQSGLI